MKKSTLSRSQIQVMEKVNAGEHLSAFANLRNPFFSGMDGVVLVPYNTFKSLVDDGLLYKTDVECNDGRFYFMSTERGKRLGT